MPQSANSLKHEDLPYRPCVGLMLINHDGQIFVGRRIDQTVEAWQMPQGGIDDQETPIEAGLREMKEEIGTDKAVLLRELDEWLCYDLPQHLLGVALQGRYRGQKQKWLALRFSGRDDDINIKTQEPEFAAWKWVSVNDLAQIIVPFKRAIYTQIASAFRDLATPVTS